MDVIDVESAAVATIATSFNVHQVRHAVKLSRLHLASPCCIASTHLLGDDLIQLCCFLVSLWMNRMARSLPEDPCATAETRNEWARRSQVFASLREMLQWLGTSRDPRSRCLAGYVDRDALRHSGRVQAYSSGFPLVTKHVPRGLASLNLVRFLLL